MNEWIRTSIKSCSSFVVFSWDSGAFVPFDPIEKPEHYNSHPSGIEPIEITEHMNFCLGNAIKYIIRCDLKGNAIQDLEKAIWYLTREVDRRKRLGVK